MTEDQNPAHPRRPEAGSSRDCDILICGLGPVGQLLALLLGHHGVSTIAVDEAAEPYDLPRAAVVDDEVLRILPRPHRRPLARRTRAARRRRRARHAAVHRPGTDTSGAIGDWLQRHDADWVLLRPDRYVFACGSTEDAGHALQALRRTVGNSARADIAAGREAVAA